MSKGIPLIRAGMLLPVVQLLERIGAPVDTLLERAAIPVGAFLDPELLLALHQVGRFLEDAAASEGIRELGFAAAPLTSVAALGALGAVMRACPTPLEALQTGAALHARYASGGRVWLDYEPDRIWLRHAADRRIAQGRAVVQQLSLILLLRLLRAVLGPGWRPLAIETPLDHAPTAADLDLPGLVPVKASAPSTGVAVARRSLATPIPAQWRVAAPIEPMKRDLLAQPAALDFAGSVRQVVGTLLLDGYPDLERTCRAIGLSRRTLQRRLAESGLSYSRLVERERFEHALALLADPRRTITEVAFALGYSDVANFTHAFHRWTGLSPRQYRAGPR